MKLIIAIVITVWLVLGIAASLQRGYFGNDQAVSCKTGSGHRADDPGRPTQLRRREPQGPLQGATALRMSRPGSSYEATRSSPRGATRDPSVVWTSGLPPMRSLHGYRTMSVLALGGGLWGIAGAGSLGELMKIAIGVVCAVVAGVRRIRRAAAQLLRPRPDLVRRGSHCRRDHRRRAAQLPGAQPPGLLPGAVGMILGTRGAGAARWSSSSSATRHRPLGEVTRPVVDSDEETYEVASESM